MPLINTHILQWVVPQKANLLKEDLVEEKGTGEGVWTGKQSSVTRGALVDFTKLLANLAFQIYPLCFSLPVPFAQLVLTIPEARASVSLCFLPQ